MISHNFITYYFQNNNNNKKYQLLNNLVKIQFTGIQSNTNEPIDCCMYYDGFTKAWIPLPDMPYRLIRHRSNVIEQKGRDYRWLIAGGLSKCFFVCIFVCIDYITQLHTYNGQLNVLSEFF